MALDIIKCTGSTIYILASGWTFVRFGYGLVNVIIYESVLIFR